MSNIFSRLLMALKDKAIMKRVLFVVIGLAVFRLLAAIPIPGVDSFALDRLFEGNQFLGLFNILSGGGLANLSIVMLGVGPYITASIIIQVLMMIIPSLKVSYQEDGEAGRAKLSQYSRMLTVPLAMIQSFGFIKLLQSQQVIGSLDGLSLITNVLIITGGSILLMWIGELITEFGIGNGTSLIIFAGIVANLPTKMIQEIQKAVDDPSVIIPLVMMIVGAVLITFFVVLVTEAERSVPVTYSRQVRGERVIGGVQTYIPLRLNQAGVIPIIFALSILLFPQMILSFLSRSSNASVADIASTGMSWFSNQWVYGVIYFVLVVLFTYFYTAITFDPKNMSENLQKNGAFVSGIRPGEQTMVFFEKIVTRITLVGALFLGAVAILPLIFKGYTGDSTFAIGGTSLLIVVSVVLDLVKKIDAQVSMREY